MAKEKRYTVVLDAYVYARNDHEAKVKAAQMVKLLQKYEDNHAATLSLHETPFGSTENRLIHKGKLELFDNTLYSC